MGLVQDTGFVSTSEVEAISGEVNLASLDATSGGATLANAIIQATNYLILCIRNNGIDPSKVANVSDLKIPAALYAAYTRLVADPDDALQARAKIHKARFDEAFSKYVFVSSDTASTEQTLGAKGLPRGISLDAVPFFPATDNRTPHQRYGGTGVSGFSTKSH